MGCGVYWTQINELDRALGSLRRLGIAEDTPAYMQLTTMRGNLMAQVGFKFPRTVTQLAKLVGMSPGIIALWHDVESGWMAEARVRPGAPPVYKAVSDEVAVAILNREVSPELEKELMAPVDYFGE